MKGPAECGGHKPGSEMGRLSNILKMFSGLYCLPDDL